MDARRLKSRVRLWKDRLLPDWRIDFEFKTLDDGDGIRTMGQCAALWHYKAAVVELDHLKITTMDEADELIVHELMHAMLAPLHHANSEILEYVVTNMAKCVVKAYKKVDSKK